jgi:hypothetical protein
LLVKKMTLLQLIDGQPHDLLVHRHLTALFESARHLGYRAFAVALSPYQGGRLVQTICHVAFHIIDKQLAWYFTRQDPAGSGLRQIVTIRMLHWFSQLLYRTLQPGPAQKLFRLCNSACGDL